MSDDWLLVIPADPAWVPSGEAANTALAYFRERVPAHARTAATVQAKLLDEIQVVHQGSNWERLRCPYCSTELETGWWTERMEEAYATKFTRLGVVVPCCGKQTSLNDLRYEWPAGFARFILSAMNPEHGWLADAELNAIEATLGHPVRQILRHI